jgi:hypothetical protein
MTHPEAPTARARARESAAPTVALMDCGPDEAAARVIALVELAERLGSQDAPFAGTIAALAARMA